MRQISQNEDFLSSYVEGVFSFLREKKEKNVYCSVCFTVFKSGVYLLESQTSNHFCGFSMAAPQRLMV